MTTETQVIPSALDSVFDALVKAVADRILDQVTQSAAFETKVSSVLETLLNDDSVDSVLDHKIDRWFGDNFSIHDYDSEINQMIDLEDDIRNTIKDMSFTVSVD